MPRITLNEAKTRQTVILGGKKDEDFLDDLHGYLGDATTFKATVTAAGEDATEWLELLTWAKTLTNQGEEWINPYLTSLRA